MNTIDVPDSRAPVGNEDEIAFGYRLAYSYVRWANRRSEFLGYPQCGNILGLYKPAQRTGELQLDDDQMVLIDRSYTRMSWRERKIMYIEFFVYETQEQKAKRFNLSRRNFRRRVDEVMLELYQSLMPESEAWRLAVL